jgi:hypothetical protein
MFLPFSLDHPLFHQGCASLYLHIHGNVKNLNNFNILMQMAELYVWLRNLTGFLLKFKLFFYIFMLFYTIVKNIIYKIKNIILILF